MQVHVLHIRAMATVLKTSGQLHCAFQRVQVECIYVFMDVKAGEGLV